MTANAQLNELDKNHNNGSKTKGMKYKGLFVALCNFKSQFMSELKKVKVKMNWDNWKEVILQVPAAWTKAQIDKALTKKYGIYDIYNWNIIEEETTT